MCGIAGIINFNNHSVGQEQLTSMHRALAHRGPDDYAVYLDQQIGLSHARLSIIDLSPAGRQPISNEDGSIWLVCNGEIYNYRELQTPLLDKKHHFISHSDSEVLIHLYEEEGIDCIRKLNGMFAFCIYDKKKGKLFLARDRMGIKPLYYYFDQKQFLFASEIKAILTQAAVDKTIDCTAISEYLSLAYIPAPRSAFKKIKKLKPAEYLELDIKTATPDIKSYWDLQPIKHNRDEHQVGQRIIQLLSEAVRMRLVSDVALGAFLSGGIDSSIIVALMARASNNRVKTFTVGFADQPQFDETFYAQKVAQMYHTDHTEIKLSYEDFIGYLPGILDSFDEPFADCSSLPTFMVSKATRHHVKVALSGDGADELFVGYNKYIGMKIQRLGLLLPKISGPLLRYLLHRPLASFDSQLFGRLKRRAQKMLAGLGQGDLNSHISWMRQLSATEKQGLLNLDFQNDPGERELLDSIAAYYGKFNTDWINQASYADLKLQLPDDMLSKIDRMSMLTSLEVRVPFLDHRLVNEVFSLSGKMKMRNWRRKYILLKAAKGLLPAGLADRPKKGFELPLGAWFKQNRKLQQLFMDCIQTKGRGDLLQTDNVIKLFHLHRDGRVDYNRELWILLCLKWWDNKYL